MEANRTLVKTFLEAWCTREFDRLSGRLDGTVIESLHDVLRVVPLEVLRADVLTVDDGLQFDFRFRVPSDTVGGHVVDERVLVHTRGDGVSALDLFGTRLTSETRVRELVA